MKKLLLLLLMVFLMSCEKEKETTYCWRCESYTATLNFTEITQYCDKTVEEILEIEKEGSNIFTTVKCTKY